MESNKQEVRPTDKRKLMPSPRKSDDVNGRMIFLGFVFCQKLQDCGSSDSLTNNEEETATATTVCILI